MHTLHGFLLSNLMEATIIAVIAGMAILAFEAQRGINTWVKSSVLCISLLMLVWAIEGRGSHGGIKFLAMEWGLLAFLIWMAEARLSGELLLNKASRHIPPTGRKKLRAAHVLPRYQKRAAKHPFFKRKKD